MPGGPRVAQSSESPRSKWYRHVNCSRSGTRQTANERLARYVSASGPTKQTTLGEVGRGAVVGN